MEYRQVFISYHFDDAAEYGNLVDVLKHVGVPYRTVAPRPGSPLSDELRRQLSDCEVCIFLCTTRSLASGWCQAELGAFWGAGKPVVVCIADQSVSDSSLPPQFRGSTWTRSLHEAAREAKRLIARVLTTLQSDRVPGHRLFQHGEYYPVDLEEGTNRPSINAERFGKAVKYLLDDADDPLAATDLVYLRVDNLPHAPDVLPTNRLQQYEAFVRKYRLEAFIANFEQEKHRVFRNYVRLVNDIGGTLRDVFFEILLHDVRNPIRSIIAAQNSERVSGRRVFDPSTRFVVQYVRNQGRELFAAMEGGSKVAYFKQFTRTKQVKATTTPVYDDRYGLVGILCMNIDIEAVQSLDDMGSRRFFERYMWNTGVTPEFERDQCPP